MIFGFPLNLDFSDKKISQYPVVIKYSNKKKIFMNHRVDKNDYNLNEFVQMWINKKIIKVS